LRSNIVVDGIVAIVGRKRTVETRAVAGVRIVHSRRRCRGVVVVVVVAGVRLEHIDIINIVKYQLGGSDLSWQTKTF
jgi:hypothetical protein